MIEVTRNDIIKKLKEFSKVIEGGEKLDFELDKDSGIHILMAGDDKIVAYIVNGSTILFRITSSIEGYLPNVKKTLNTLNIKMLEWFNSLYPIEMCDSMKEFCKKVGGGYIFQSGSTNDFSCGIDDETNRPKTLHEGVVIDLYITEEEKQNITDIIGESNLNTHYIWFNGDSYSVVDINKRDN